MPTLELPEQPRLLLSTALRPLQGQRFQPTGFPDVGAGVFALPNGDEHLLVESAQSVANRLEAVCWDPQRQDLVAELAGLPYVRVVDEHGEFLTASVLEAHRLNSVYIEKSGFFAKLVEEVEFDESRPFSRAKLVAALLKFDIGCLLHGVFLESIAGVLRVPRALSGFVEAERVARVQTGGVKNDRVRAGKDADSGRTAKEGFGNVPFHRTEFVADRITAYFNVDLDQLRSYALGPDVERLLYALALFKIHRFLRTGLRLRTACDFEAVGLEVKGGVDVPNAGVVAELLPELVAACAARFASPAVTQASYGVGERKTKKAEKSKS